VIGSLLKQLWVALGSFIRYHLSRLFGRREQSPPAFEGESAARPTAEQPPSVGLDPIYERLTPWQTDQSDLFTPLTTSNPIYQLWRETPEGHKWSHYFETYQTVFNSRRDTPMRILEIGVFRGASLRLWKTYFRHAETRVVGIDIDPACAIYDAPPSGIHVRIGSQTDDEFLAKVVAEFGPFDLIIDDGSHHSAHIIKSFNCLYHAALKDDGIYFVEDLHANYWLPWRDSANSFLDFCKDLLELMHAHYWKNPLPVWTEQARSGSILTVEVPEITTMIKEIRIFDSIVVIYKMRRPHAPRYIVA
jgi:SAM-dependent methyltransferase